jgi:hypothetical protein
MRFAPYLIGLGLAVLTPLACGTSTGTTTAVARPQLVAVDPDDFMGHVACEAPPELPPGAAAGAAGSENGTDAPPPRDPNAVHSYVATLFDVTPDADGGVPNPGVPLASSPPTTCAQQVTFAFVVDGRRYVAEIDAYHEEPNELFAITAGSRLVTHADGSRALPGWNLAVCGGYPPSRSADAGAGTGGTGTGGADGSGGAASGSGGAAGGERPPGVISYVSITQTPHNCSPVLEEPEAD